MKKNIIIILLIIGLGIMTYLYCNLKEIKKNNMFSNEVEQLNQLNTESKQYEEKEKIISNVEYIEISVCDRNNTEYIMYKQEKKIKDKVLINELSERINNCVEYEEFENDFGAGDFCEGNPIVNIYDKNNNKIILTACDNFSMDVQGNFYNIMMIWTKDNEEDRIIYKVNNDLQKFLEEIYEKN